MAGSASGPAVSDRSGLAHPRPRLAPCRHERVQRRLREEHGILVEWSVAREGGQIEDASPNRAPTRGLSPARRKTP